jgi:hypothetical protein
MQAFALYGGIHITLAIPRKLNFENKSVIFSCLYHTSMAFMKTHLGQGEKICSGSWNEYPVFSLEKSNSQDTLFQQTTYESHTMNSTSRRNNIINNQRKNQSHTASTEVQQMHIVHSIIPKK